MSSSKFSQYSISTKSRSSMSSNSNYGTQGNPAISGIDLFNRGFRTSGVYWINPTGNYAFPAYIILDRYDGGYVKFLQYFDGANLSGSEELNNNGAWISSEINTSGAGKIRTADITALNTTQSFLCRVTGSSDPLFNNGSGTARFRYLNGSLPQWGTDSQPQIGNKFIWELDTTSNGTFDYCYRYVNTRLNSRCNHSTSIFVSDHNSPPDSGSGWQSATTPVSVGAEICWTFGPTGAYTNLHPWSGTSTSSGGSINWGTGNGSAWAMFIK